MFKTQIMLPIANNSDYDKNEDLQFKDATNNEYIYW
jgi:hypothetical protein